MIISHQLRAVFVKTRKTAGTSFELSLSTAVGPRDVVTPLTDDEEALRREMGGRPPQNYLLAPWKIRRKHLRMFLKKKWPRSAHAHSSARHARALIGDQRWNDYFTFTIERNSWDKAVSRYARLASQKAVPPFEQWVLKCPPHLLSCFELYSQDERLIVKRVLRYERLADEVQDVWKQLDITPKPMPYAKRGFRQSKDWRPLYNQAALEHVARVCHREIALFGFSFDDYRPRATAAG